MPLLFERFKVFENELVFCCNLFILLQNGLQSGFVLRLDDLNLVMGRRGISSGS
jgi:hypothetical protein